MPMTKDAVAELERILPDPMGINTLAHFLEVDYRTVWKAIQSGDLRAAKKLGEWTIRRADVVRWLSDNWN